MDNKKVFIKSAYLGYINIILLTVIGIVSQPLLLNYFGAYQFGIWTLTLTLLTYVGNSSVGIPAAVTVMLSKSKSINVKKQIVKKSLLLLVGSSLFVLIICMIINYLYKDWIIVLGEIPSSLTDIAKKTVIISVILLLFRLPMQVAQSAFSGYQDIHIGKLYEVFNTIVPFIALLITIKFDLGLIQMAIVVGLGLTIINAISLLHLSKKHSIFKNIVQDNDTYHRISYSEIFKSGYDFFIIGIAFVIIYNTDQLVISHFIGPEYIAPYIFAFKLYNMPLQLFNVLIGIIFPMYGKYYAEKNYNWIQNIYSIMTSLFPILGGAIWIGGLLISKDIINIWSGNNQTFGGYLLVFAMGGFIYSLSSVNVHSTLLSGIDKKKQIVWLIWLEGILNLILSIILGKWIGISGVALGTMLSSFLVPFILLPHYVNKNTDGNIKFNFIFTLKHFISSTLPFLIIGGILVNLEFYSESQLIRLVICFLIMFIYITISYIILPKNVKVFITNNLNKKIKFTN